MKCNIQYKSSTKPSIYLSLYWRLQYLYRLVLTTWHDFLDFNTLKITIHCFIYSLSLLALYRYIFGLLVKNRTAALKNRSKILALTKNPLICFFSSLLFRRDSRFHCVSLLLYDITVFECICIFSAILCCFNQPFQICQTWTGLGWTTGYPLKISSYRIKFWYSSISTLFCIKYIFFVIFSVGFHFYKYSK